MTLKFYNIDSNWLATRPPDHLRHPESPAGVSTDDNNQPGRSGWYSKLATSLERGQLTISQKSPRSEYNKGSVYRHTPPDTKLSRPDAMLDPDRSEGWKQTLVAEYAVEILPTIGIKCINRGVVVHDGDIAHARKWGEAVQRFFPKPSVRLVEMWPDSQ